MKEIRAHGAHRRKPVRKDEKWQNQQSAADAGESNRNAHDNSIRESRDVEAAAGQPAGGKFCLRHVFLEHPNDGGQEHSGANYDLHPVRRTEPG